MFIITEASFIKREHLKDLKSCFKSIQGHPNSKEFRKLAPQKSLNFGDYFEMVKIPMDLDTVNKKLIAGKYKKYM